MQERRKNGRFALPSDIIGNFLFKSNGKAHVRRDEKFIVKDIGFGGFNVVSNFSPEIGSVYVINIEKKKSRLKFEVQVIFSNIMKFMTDKESIFKPGILYSIGCKIKGMENFQRQCIKYLIQNKSDM